MKEIKARLAAETETILDNVKRIQQWEGRVPQIELDVLLDSIRGMYVSALELNKLNAMHEDIGRASAIAGILQQQAVAELVEEAAKDTEEAVAEGAAEVSESEPTIDEHEMVEDKPENKQPIADSNSNVVAETPIVADDKFDAVVEKDEMLQEMASNDDDILSNPTIMEFEPIEDENEEKSATEQTPALDEEPVDQEPMAEPAIAEEPELTPIEEEEPVAEEKTIVPEVHETPSMPQEQSEEQELGKEPAATEHKEEERKPATTETHHEEPRQISLFDYLKSSNVTKAAEQVDRFSGSGVKTLADKFLESKERERMLFATKQDREERKQPRVEDLRTIIGVNDKFLFINELFGENMRAYNDFIMKLTKMDANATDEALAYLKTIEEQYGWDKESLAVQTFRKIFERKFK